MNHFQQGMKSILLAQLLLFLISSTSFAIQVNGVGPDREQALNNAFQSAIEAELGVAVKSTAMSENFVLIKKEIVTHSKGYVTNYHIVSEKTDGDGTVTVVIDARVDRNLIISHTQTLDILMKMAGHPKVVVLGVDENLEAVPADTEIFDKLLNVVSQIFQEKFRFEVLDWQAFRAKHSDIEGGLTREMVIRHNDRLKADVMIPVELNLLKDKTARNTAKARLALKGIRISDNYLIGKTYRNVGAFPTKGLNQQGIFKAAVSATEKEDIFIGAIDLAKKIVEAMNDELDRGHGFRYTISFYDFPDMEKVKEELTGLQGYVRHNIVSKKDSEMTLAYWSNLKTDNLQQQIQELLDTNEFDYRTKIEGRMLRFKWKHPEDF